MEGLDCVLFPAFLPRKTRNLALPLLKTPVQYLYSYHLWWNLQKGCNVLLNSVLPLTDLSVVAEDDDGEKVAQETEEGDGGHEESLGHVLELAHAHHGEVE